MPKPNTQPLYRILLRLYPKSHRLQYGEQMLQTVDDLLAEHKTASARAGIWIRIILELPANLVEEHIQNIRSGNMKIVKRNKKSMAIVVIVGFALVTVGVFLFLARRTQYTPTTLSNVQRPNPAVACIQNSDNKSLSIDDTDKNFIINNVVSSIIDVPAGTNVEVYLKSYDGKNASGTAVYQGKFGNYNFTAKKTSDSTGNNYTGNWKVTNFEACSR